ncbi:MAG: rod shape-determining protein MreD, partial [Sedimentisphaerales bacterium]|nr:rod shape-determining protein MreD [Sedimentisphaerales bacterium]
MRWFRFAVVIVVATVLQTSLVDVIAVTTADINPDLLLILLLFFAIHGDRTEAVITAFAAGFAAD